MKGLKVLGLVIGMGLLILPVWANLDLDEYEQQKEAFGKSYTEAVDQSSTSSTSSSSAILVQSVPRQGSSLPKVSCSSKPLEIMGFNARSTKSDVARQLTAWGISYEENRFSNDEDFSALFQEPQPYGLPDGALKITKDLLKGGCSFACYYVEYEGIVWQQVGFYFDRLGRLIIVMLGFDGQTAASCQTILNTFHRITQAYPAREREDDGRISRKGGCNNLEWIHIWDLRPQVLIFEFMFFRWL